MEGLPQPRGEAAAAAVVRDLDDAVDSLGEVAAAACDLLELRRLGPRLGKRCTHTDTRIRIMWDHVSIRGILTLMAGCSVVCFNVVHVISHFLASSVVTNNVVSLLAVCPHGTEQHYVGTSVDTVRHKIVVRSWRQGSITSIQHFMDVAAAAKCRFQVLTGFPISSFGS